MRLESINLIPADLVDGQGEPIDGMFLLSIGFFKNQFEKRILTFTIKTMSYL